MAKYFAQQFNWMGLTGISGQCSYLEKDNLPDIKAALKDFTPQIYPWIIFRGADEGNQFFPIMYLNFIESKWVETLNSALLIPRLKE